MLLFIYTTFYSTNCTSYRLDIPRPTWFNFVSGIRDANEASRLTSGWLLSASCVRKQKEPEDLAPGPHPVPKSNQGLGNPWASWAKLSPYMNWKSGPISLEISTFHELLDPIAAECSNRHECEVTAKFCSQSKWFSRNQKWWKPRVINKQEIQRAVLSQNKSLRQNIHCRCKHSPNLGQGLKKEIGKVVFEKH